MRHRRGLLVLACLLAVVLTTGASCFSSLTSPGNSAQSAGPNAPQDRGGLALAAARKTMQPVAGDAVPIMVGSAGVALNPHPSNGRFCSHRVQRGARTR